MKKVIFCLFVSSLSITFIPNELKAAPGPVKTQSSSQAAEAKVLINRLEELKSIDKSSLSRSDKKVLRKEVRSIDSRLREISGGIYLSAGGIILILILLIIFL
jgi:hypothetical protein